MLFHVSIDARDPQRVASVIAELFGDGRAVPFPPVAKGSWLAMARDERSTAVEVYPRGTVLRRWDDESDGGGFHDDRAAALPGSATHFAMATRLEAEQVFEIAAREGWPAKYFKRGGPAGFGLIEVWIEGEHMIEVLTDEMQAEYLAATEPGRWEETLERAGELLGA
jgi:hypothetical protein